MMSVENIITKYTTADVLFRLKKTLRFIEEVVEDHRKNALPHMSFALMLAISKAEELRGQVEPRCPEYRSFQELTEMLRYVPNSHEARETALFCIENIRRYFNLAQVVMKPKIRVLKEQG